MCFHLLSCQDVQELLLSELLRVRSQQLCSLSVVDIMRQTEEALFTRCKTILSQFRQYIDCSHFQNSMSFT